MVLGLAGVALGLGMVAEGVARWGLGLGDPPLMLADARMEYRARPGDYQRLGNRMSFNAVSMRSDPVPPARDETAGTPHVLRVLFLGDSVIHGGSQTDQDELATSILQRKLTAALGRPVWVGNASAGSWGPGNWLAYTQTFGWFDADAVVVVASGHDAGDAMTFDREVGVDPQLPGADPGRPRAKRSRGICRSICPSGWAGKH